jgi:hypothetical protein
MFSEGKVWVSHARRHAKIWAQLDGLCDPAEVLGWICGFSTKAIHGEQAVSRGVYRIEKPHPPVAAAVRLCHVLYILSYSSTYTWQ